MDENMGADSPHGKNQEKKAGLDRPKKDHSLSKSEPHLVLKVDERQRLARERREEHEKLMAAREQLWLEKEVRARQHYEKHMEERRKRLEEQRIKEERRRAAVDEKRRQKLEEEKERHEAVVKRTMQRSQKPRQKSNRWSWGGSLHSNQSISSSDPDRRSFSTMNLTKHVDPVINKRLSTSSAALLNSPDRGRRPQLSPWESNVVSRLLTPTHSYLARSKSTAALSGDAASCSPISPQTQKTPTIKSSERPKSFLTTPEAIARRRTTHFVGFGSGEKKEKRENEKESKLLTPTSIVKRTHSSSIPRTKSLAALSGGHQQKSSVTISSVSKPASSPSTSSKVVTTPQRPPSPGNVRPVKRESKKKKEDKQPDVTKEAIENTETKDSIPADVENTKKETPRSPSPVTSETAQALPSTPVTPSPTVSNKPFAGTNNPEEATRILAEKRRLAREQREREDEEKREREEEQRKKKEELARRKAEERAKQEEEAQRKEEERKQMEEKELQEREKILQQQAEEREQREREEAERLQKQKEEADRVRLEREKHFQKEEQERSERKKRLEEIMKRTRRSEAGDKQTTVQRNGEIPKIPEKTAITSSSLHDEQESVTSSPRIITFQQTLPLESTENQPNENGLCTPNNNFEEIINLPIGTKPIKLDALNNEGNSMEDLPLNPIIAFEVDNVQTPQTAEVI
ncbi:ensconsin isoform X2 [Pyxicephalus adspersus]|uniref:ensconsin isoform X2 n=1 Tax=Pyxicephalus adspersus TaxID=30357 RepID=UPI003B59F480